MDFPALSQEWLAVENQTGGRLVINQSNVDECRAIFEAVFEQIRSDLPPPSASVKVVDVDITPTQHARVYIPVGGSSPMPVGLYIHSGGWYTGSIESEDFLCRRIAERSRIILCSPFYRLAPENPYPAGLDDCCRAYEHLHENAVKYGGDPTKKFLMGGSAGGNLAACVSLKYAADPMMKPAGSILACFMSCDPKSTPDAHRKTLAVPSYTNTPMIDNKSVQQAREWYACPDPSDPLYSPLLHPDLARLSRVHIVATMADPTYPETLAFYQECVAKGVSASLGNWEGLPHFFWILPNFPKSAEFMEEWCQKLDAMIQDA